jgi:hypothetical protein
VKNIFILYPQCLTSAFIQADVKQDFSTLRWEGKVFLMEELACAHARVRPARVPTSMRGMTGRR